MSDFKAISGRFYSAPPAETPEARSPHYLTTKDTSPIDHFKFNSASFNSRPGVLPSIDSLKENSHIDDDPRLTTWSTRHDAQQARDLLGTSRDFQIKHSPSQQEGRLAALQVLNNFDRFDRNKKGEISRSDLRVMANQTGGSENDKRNAWAAQTLLQSPSDLMSAMRIKASSRDDHGHPIPFTPSNADYMMDKNGLRELATRITSIHGRNNEKAYSESGILDSRTRTGVNIGNDTGSSPNEISQFHNGIMTSKISSR